MTQQGRVALITGGAGGIGAALAAALAGRGYRVAVADLDETAAGAVAGRVGGLAVGLDVTDPAANRAAVERVLAEYGRLDVVALNAGVSTGHEASTAGAQLDLAAYRRIVGVNLDGVVFGVAAALPALRAAGGGSILVTASLAGLVPMASDPYYTLTKTAVVAFVRALAQPLSADGIRINALCPGFTDTAILGAAKAAFDAAGFPLLTPADVAAAFLDILDGAAGGEVWFVQPGRAAAAYRFHGVPGPVVGAGGTMAPPPLPGFGAATAPAAT